jgi:hypothetical protein
MWSSLVTSLVTSSIAHFFEWTNNMKIKQILTGVELVIADVEVELNGTLRSAATLCAIMRDDNGKELAVPLNTPDGRPILMNIENAIVSTEPIGSEKKNEH